MTTSKPKARTAKPKHHATAPAHTKKRAAAPKRKAARPKKPAQPAVPASAARLAQAVAAALDDKKAENILTIHIGPVSSLCDLFVLASGTNPRHVATLIDAVTEAAKALGERPIGREGQETGWALIDFGDVVVHVFDRDTREYYDLERLWLDAPRLDAKTVAAAAA